MHVEPQKQHQWLDQFVGEWVSETECSMGSDQPPSKMKGTEVVRCLGHSESCSLGGLWIIAEGMGEGSDASSGKTMTTMMTLGFDPQSDRFVGTFIGTMMTHLWIYNGSLDATEKVLTLDTEGPNFAQGAMTKYKDIIEFVSTDHRIMTSQILGDDGNWLQFMTAHYRRQ
jgi:Protein of unknown function (DUF1579)